MSHITYRQRRRQQAFDQKIVNFQNPRSPTPSRRHTTLDEIRESYMHNFTLHGLTKICMGLWWERLIWFASLTTCIAIVVHFALGFYQQYIKYDVRTEIRVSTSKNISLPALTVCYRLCEFCDFDFPTDIACYKNKSSDGTPCLTENTLIHKTLYSIPTGYLTPHPLRPNCITINRHGNFTTLSLETSETYQLYTIAFDHSLRHVHVYAYVHDQDDMVGFIKPEPISTVIQYPQDKDLELEFTEKQYLNRLPSPYPSNCSYGQHNENLLPAPYTEGNCLYTCVLKRLISKCGTLPEYILQ